MCSIKAAHRLSVFLNGVLGIVLDISCRMLGNEELHILYLPSDYFYADQVKGDEVEGYVACIVDMRNACKILVGKPRREKTDGKFYV